MAALTVVFDLDGTLVDTAPDLVDALNAALRHEGLPPVPHQEGRAMIGGGGRRMVELGLKWHGRTPQPAHVDRRYADFLAHYSDHIADQSRPFPGAAAALDRLIGQGHQLAVCTNKLENLSRRLLDALGMSGHFTAICGQDTFGIQKPDPEILRRTVLAAQGAVGCAIMIGDSSNDIDVARAVGMPVVAVDFCYTETPVATLRPDRIVSHFDQLPAAVAELAGRLS